MNYNFDEIIDRRYTNSMNVEGYKGYLFGNTDTSDLKDNDELIRMWVADMDFSTPEVVLNAIRERLNKKILGYTNVFGSEYMKLLFLGQRNVMVLLFLKSILYSLMVLWLD